VQAGEARRFLADILDGSPAAGDATACLSELVNNAIVHSSSGRAGVGTFTVAVRLEEGRLWAEVRDQGGPWSDVWAPDAEHGRGLLIVSRIACAWGRGGSSADGWSVWFTLDWS
jgi:anti-sigma regulatory factor (Ser/Thr protein kinase)